MPYQEEFTPIPGSDPHLYLKTHLYASVSSDVAPERLAELLDARNRAELAEDDDPVEVAGRTFLIAPSSHRGYAIRLKSPAMDVWAHCVGRSQRPSVLIELRSLGIHTAGIEVMVEEAHQVAEWLCPGLGALAPGEGMKVSRIDLYCDVQGWAPKASDDGRWVGRARNVAGHKAKVPEDHVATFRRKGQIFSGFTFGQGSMLARVYHKTLLMATTGQDWMWEIWQAADRQLPVWRVEVQMRRGILRKFRVSSTGETMSSVRDALDHRQALWNYSVGEWLTLRMPMRADNNKWRWPVDPAWGEIQRVQIGSPCSPLVRVRHEQAARRRLLQGMTGYLTSLVAHGGSEPLREAIRTVDAAMATGTDEDRERAIRMALEGMTPEVRRYCDDRQLETATRPGPTVAIETGPTGERWIDVVGRIAHRRPRA